MKKCPNCGAHNEDDSLFCAECGKLIPQGTVCPHCGAAINEGDTFCQNCGKKADMDVLPIVDSPMVKACPHCGAAMNDGDVFCQNCGRRTNVNSQDFTPATPVAPRDHVPYRPVNYAKPGRSTNWNIIITILLCLILLTGLGIGGYFVYTNYAKKKVEATKEMEKNEPVISGDKKLYGAVDQYPITMSLNIRGSKVKGTYYYNKQGPDRVLTLSGTLKKDELDLIEYNEKGQQTGHFRGHYSKGVIEGVFTTMQGKRLSFRLTE